MKKEVVKPVVPKKVTTVTKKSPLPTTSVKGLQKGKKPSPMR